MSDVVIYNLGGTQILGTVSVKHAIKMLLRQVAVVVDAVEGQTFGPFPRPRAVELVRYIHTRWVYERTGKVPYTRAALMRRDRYRCAYCGRRADTVDHVVPRCQGGTTTWQNTVAACGPCNEAKGGRTPEQACRCGRARSPRPWRTCTRAAGAADPIARRGAPGTVPPSRLTRCLVAGFAPLTSPR